MKKNALFDNKGRLEMPDHYNRTDLVRWHYTCRDLQGYVPPSNRLSIELAKNIVKIDDLSLVFLFGQLEKKIRQTT